MTVTEFILLNEFWFVTHVYFLVPTCHMVWCTPMWDKHSYLVTLLRVFLVTSDEFWTQKL